MRSIPAIEVLPHYLAARKLNWRLGTVPIMTKRESKIETFAKPGAEYTITIYPVKGGYVASWICCECGYESASTGTFPSQDEASRAAKINLSPHHEDFHKEAKA